MFKLVPGIFPFLVLACLFSYVAPANAQDSEKAQVTAQAPSDIKHAPPLIDPPQAKRHFKIADKKFFAIAALQFGATIADFETTQWAQRKAPYGAEKNPLFGTHPSRERMYGIGFSITSIQVFMQYRSKRFGERRGRLKNAWIVGALLDTGVHTVLAAHNARIASRGN
ncbi:MAG TPA: hypothetical protein VJR23_03395 [Candidatus Acidoferrales bacterium]|nr:hypothetical protein [Candidatus Acidoferrales bacterium]